MSDRMSFKPVFWSRDEISRRVPFLSAILEDLGVIWIVAKD